MNEGWIAAFGIVLTIAVAAMAYDIGRASVRNDCADYGKAKAGSVLIVCEVKK